MGFWNSRKAKREESARERIGRARIILSHARAQPDYCCDVCGPHYGHYHYSCWSAASDAIKGLLIFRGRQFEDPADLKSLTTLAFEGLRDRDRCLAVVNRLLAYPDFRDEAPTQSESHCDGEHTKIPASPLSGKCGLTGITKEEQ